MYKTVHCEKNFKIDAEQIWSLLKDFSNEWHPMVNYMSFERGPKWSIDKKIHNHWGMRALMRNN